MTICGPVWLLSEFSNAPIRITNQLAISCRFLFMTSHMLNWVIQPPSINLFLSLSPWYSITTSLKINMEPKNGGLENDFTVQLGDFLVPC